MNSKPAIKSASPVISEAPKIAKLSIKTSKWSWASPVQSKNVYRDEEFIESSTKEEALEANRFLLRKPKGLTYTITVLRDGVYFTHYRHSMPCLGGLVKYRDSHGEKYSLNPYFPRDIYVAFPEGEVIFVGSHLASAAKVLQNPYFEFVLSQESPWVSAFGNRESIVIGDSYFILTNMDTDPTVFYSLMRLGGMTGYFGNVPKDWNIKAYLLQSKTNVADPRRLAGQMPIRISGGTWAQGFGYTRCFNESIFKTSLPSKLKDFNQFTRGYPQAPFTNKYFLDTMKEKFGVDAAKGTADRKLHDALLESWDYFREESGKLGDGFPV